MLTETDTSLMEPLLFKETWHKFRDCDNFFLQILLSTIPPSLKLSQCLFLPNLILFFWLFAPLVSSSGFSETQKPYWKIENCSCTLYKCLWLGQCFMPVLEVKLLSLLLTSSIKKPYEILKFLKEEQWLHIIWSIILSCLLFLVFFYIVLRCTQYASEHN